MFYEVVLYFPPPGYIAQPMWPETRELISIHIAAGLDPNRTSNEQTESLKAELLRRGMDEESYLRLCLLASRPFYLSGKDIVIPPRNFDAMLRRSMFLLAGEDKRASRCAGIQLLEPGVVTERTAADGRFFRQIARQWIGDPYIQDFAATGTIQVWREVVSAAELFEVLRYAGQRIGIGACRSQGFGRFKVVKLAEKSSCQR